MQYVIVSEVKGEAGHFNDEIRKEVREVLGAKSSKLPAHFTIKAPFEYEGPLTALESVLERFVKEAQSQPYRLEGYDHFEDRVVYMKVIMSQEGKALHDKLIYDMMEVPYIHFSETDGIDKTLHVTVSSKKIRPIFYKLWEYVHQYPCSYPCQFDNIAIYRWENNTWELYRRYEF